MYTLTLTEPERAAFTWVGNRYGSTGDEMADLIRQGMPRDCEWSQDGDIAFSVPEHVAWSMRDLANVEDGYWPCFAPELAYKLESFLDGIV